MRSAWCAVRGARCAVRGARCVVRGARCVVGGGRSVTSGRSRGEIGRRMGREWRGGLPPWREGRGVHLQVVRAAHLPTAQVNRRVASVHLAPHLLAHLASQRDQRTLAGVHSAGEHLPATCRQSRGAGSALTARTECSRRKVADGARSGAAHCMWTGGPTPVPFHGAFIPCTSYVASRGALRTMHVPMHVARQGWRTVLPH